MSMRTILALTLATLVSSAVQAANSKEDALRAAGIAVPPKADPAAPPAAKGNATPDMEPVMTKKGKLIWADSFDKGAIGKGWNKYKGDWQADGDNIKCQEIASDGHHPAMSRGLGAKRGEGVKDVIIQASFRFDGAKWLGLSLDNKEHVARCMLTPTGFKVVKMSGIGGTTKGENVDTKNFKFELGKWYTIMWECRGQEMFARINDETFAFGELAGVETEKLRFELINGGEWCGWDEVRVWEAEENPKWAALKATLQASKPKSQKKP